MRYWLIKGNPSENDLDEMLSPGRVASWRTRRPPRDWAPRDRVFFWSSSPRLELVGLGEFKGTTGEYTDGGATVYRVKYLTGPLPNPIRAAVLRADPICGSANFLKPSVAQGVLQVPLEHANRMYGLLRQANPNAPDIWPDVPPTGDLPPSESDAEALEGQPKLRAHLIRERDRDLVLKKKIAVLRTTGRLRCEVCGFDFAEKYGELGREFCEVHHKIPLASLQAHRVTRMEDLSVVCANCHRMLHRAKPLLSTSGLKRHLAKS